MNTLQITEFKFTEKVAAKVEFNYQQIKAFLHDSLVDFENAVITVDTVKDAKKTCADLNKLAKVIDDQRKKTKKELESPIKTFEGQMKELFTEVKSARENIYNQVKFFEDETKEENRLIAVSLIDATSHEVELWPKYLQQVVCKEEYSNLTSNPTKVKKDIVDQFNHLLMLQNQEQQKIDTIQIIVDTYNEQLQFKFDVKEFDYLLEEDIKTISETVKSKVVGRLDQEKETKERLEREKQEAIIAAELKVKQEAEALALKVKKDAEQAIIEAENAHKEELRQAEIRKAAELRKLEEEKNQIIEVANEQIDLIIPEEVQEDDPTVEFSFNVKGTQGQMEALRNYLNQYGYDWSELF